MERETGWKLNAVRADNVEYECILAKFKFRLLLVNSVKGSFPKSVTI